MKQANIETMLQVESLLMDCTDNSGFDSFYELPSDFVRAMCSMLVDYAVIHDGYELHHPADLQVFVKETVNPKHDIH